MRGLFGPDRPLRNNLKGYPLFWPQVSPKLHARWSFLVFEILPNRSKSEVSSASSHENMRRVSCERLAWFGLAPVWFHSEL